MNQPQYQQTVDSSLSDLLPPATDQPKDTVSSIQWIPSSLNMFACGTWDGVVKLFDINNMNQLYQRTQFQIGDPITSVCWRGDAQGLYVANDQQVKMVDCNTGQIMPFGSFIIWFVGYLLGKHDGIITGMHQLDNNLLMTCSIDKTIKFWQNNSPTPVMTINFDHKIYVSDHVQGVTALGLANEKMAVFELANLQNLQNNRWTLYLENPTNTMISSLMLQKTMDNQFLMGIGSYDGRANISNVMKDNSQMYINKTIKIIHKLSYKMNHVMTFKCHKVEDAQKNTEVFPVSSIQGNSRNPKWILTSGGEGKMIFWDLEQKNKIKEFSYLSQPVTKSKVSPNGMYVAYALGNDWTEGVWSLEKRLQPKVAVHVVQNQEMRFQ